MTFYEILSEKEKAGKTITAYRKTEKFSRVASYEIVTSKDGIAIDIEKAARTTWKKKFENM